MLIESSLRTSRYAKPVYLGGSRVGCDEVNVSVEVTAIFASDEAAADYVTAVKELLEQS